MPENSQGAEKKALLDNVRQKYGVSEMRNRFYGVYLQDRDKAAGLINDGSLQFPSLYVLRTEIKKLMLEPFLSARNLVALDIVRDLLARRHPSAFKYRSEDFHTLRWMFTTGWREADLGDEYDEIMDLAALLLVKEYGDKTCLEPLAKMLFERHRKGSYTYDAEWAFFESADPVCLDMVARRLLSSDPRDVELARKLLRFIPCFEDNADPGVQYRCVTTWTRANRPYLRYTGESSQKGSNPCRFAVSLDAKYLQRDIEQHPPSPDEEPVMEAFAALKTGTQEMLGEYSERLHERDRARWSKWMGSPLEKQIETAGAAELIRRPQ